MKTKSKLFIISILSIAVMGADAIKAMNTLHKKEESVFKKKKIMLDLSKNQPSWVASEMNELDKAEESGIFFFTTEEDEWQQGILNDLVDLEEFLRCNVKKNNKLIKNVERTSKEVTQFQKSLSKKKAKSESISCKIDLLSKKINTDKQQTESERTSILDKVNILLDEYSLLLLGIESDQKRIDSLRKKLKNMTDKKDKLSEKIKESYSEYNDKSKKFADFVDGKFQKLLQLRKVTRKLFK